MAKSKTIKDIPRLVEVVGLIGAGKSTCLREMAKNLSLYYPDHPVEVEILDEELLSKLVSPFLEKVYGTTSAAAAAVTGGEAGIIVEALYSLVRLLQIKLVVEPGFYQLNNSSPQQYLDRLLTDLGITTLVSAEELRLIQDTLKYLINRLKARAVYNSHGFLSIYSRGLFDIFCFIIEHIQSHPPKSIQQDRLCNLFRTLYIEMLSLLFFWKKEDSPLPTTLEELLSLRRRLDYDIIYFYIDSTKANKNIVSRARPFELDLKGKILPRVAVVNLRLMEIYSKVMQSSSVYSSDEVVRTTLGLLKLTKPPTWMPGEGIGRDSIYRSTPSYIAMVALANYFMEIE